MDASPVQIHEYFNGEKQNVIPLYQRPYSWVDKDWQNLWTTSSFKRQNPRPAGLIFWARWFQSQQELFPLE